MAAEGAVAPGWPTRIRLLATDLLTFDARRLAFVLALRGVAGLVLPLLLADALGMTELAWVGVGAFLLAIGDCVDDGDRHQPLRLAVAAALGAVALASGVLAGSSLATAMAGMLFWGVASAMMGVYGTAFATMSVPVAWAYIVLGLPATQHSVADALRFGGLFALGGAVTLLFTLGLRPGGAFAPVRAQAAAALRAVARYLEGGGAAGPVSIETEVRGAIAEARRAAAQARGAAQGTSRGNQRTLVLIEIADRLFSLGGALREARAAPPDGAPAALRAIAGTLDGRANPAVLRRLRDDMEAQAGAVPRAGVDASALRQLVAMELVRGLGIAADDAPVPALAASPPGAEVATILAPLIANLNRHSVVGRHALRFAVVAAAAVAVFWVFPKPFGYWVPLTVTVVLKPYAGMTLARVVQRTAGTVLGIMLGLALTPMLPTAALQLTAVALLFFMMMAVLPFNYSLAIFFLSAGLIPFEHILNPSLHAEIGVYRLAATGIGAALAVVGGHLLWPNFERRGLPDLLAATCAAMAAYAGTVLAAAEGRASIAEMAAARQAAGLALTNLQASVQRALTEIGGDPDAMTATLRAATAFQRLSRTLNALLNAAPALARRPRGLEPFRAAFVAAIAAPRAADPPIPALRAAMPAGDGSAEAGIVAQLLDRLVSELEMLRDAAASAAILPAPACR